MPQVAETLPWQCISIEKACSSLQTLQNYFSLMRKAFQVVGPTGTALHTMVVLQAYQADMLKELRTCRGNICEEVFSELHRTMAHTIVRSMGAMVGKERHLWLNLTCIKEKDKVFLLDALVTPSSQFNTIVSRFWEAKRYKEAFVKFLPPMLKGQGCRQPSPNRACLRKGRLRKRGVASHAPPRRVWGLVRHAQPPKKKMDLRSLIFFHYSETGADTC